MEEKRTGWIDGGDNVIDAASASRNSLWQLISLRKLQYRSIHVTQSLLHRVGSTATHERFNSNYTTTCLLWKFKPGGGSLARPAVDPHAIVVPVQHFQPFVDIVHSNALRLEQLGQFILRNSYAIVFHIDL